MKIEIPQRLCHLPLMMDVLRRSRVLEVIDAAIGQHPLSVVLIFPRFDGPPV